MRKMFCICCFILILLCSCNKPIEEPEYAFGIPISSDNKTIIDLTTTVYTDDELESIVFFKGTLSEFDSSYKVECIRRIEDGYRVSYLGEGKIGVVGFLDDGSRIDNGFVVGLFGEKSDFEKLKKDMSWSEVYDIDPDGYYSFINSSIVGLNESYHYTTDGYYIRILYSEDYGEIVEIKIDLI